ncbi:hypothetical protein AB4528_10030 [Vibrio breoganii]
MSRWIFKIQKIIGQLSIKLSSIIRPGFATRSAIYWYGRWGMKFVGEPNYISAHVKFDGTDYRLIEIHEGVTISSYVRILTHDWSLYTIAKSMGYFSKKPLGKVVGVSIGAYSFIGTGSIIMPGSTIGKGCIIGAGTVVRGKIPDYSIVVGSPGKIVGDTREHASLQFERLNINHELKLDTEK